MIRNPEQILPSLFAALDDHRFEDLSSFYSETVEAETVLGHLSGSSQVIAALQSIHESIPTLQHLISGVVVDVDGDSGTMRANLVAVFCDAEHRPQYEGASVWRGSVKRSEGSWRITEFTMKSVWSRGTPPTL